MKDLVQLLQALGVEGPSGGGAPVAIADITQDSREVRPGSLFVALRGKTHHGLEFASQVCEQGASAILWEPGEGIESPRPGRLPRAVPCVAVPHLSARAGALADRFFDAPSARLRICAFTGTNGKTTCAYLLAQCLQRIGRSAGYIGTLGAGRVGSLLALAHTTPDAISMHRLLARMLADGIEDVAIEVSSHALDQHRIAGVRLHSAAFTNLTHDHLDYHRSMAAYGEAKARLFAFPGLRQIIINVGDGFGRELAGRLRDDGRLTAAWVEAGGDRGATAVAGPGPVSRLRRAISRNCATCARCASTVSGADSASNSTAASARSGCRRTWSAASTARIRPWYSPACWRSACRSRGLARRSVTALPPRGAWRSFRPLRAAGRWRWSTMRTRPMRWPRPSPRCASTAAASYGACSAAAATGTRQSAR
jgi:UDP-N-acetylmuramyl tripeptide synthase